MHYILSPILKLRKLRPERVTFPLAPTPCVMCVCMGGGGAGCRSSPSRSWGPSQGSVRQTHHPRALRGEHQGAPDLGGDLGGTPAESNPQSHTSQEQLGSHQGERQLSFWVFLFLCQAVPFALLFLFLQRHSALLPRGCLSPITGASIISRAPSLPPRSLMLPQRKASITGCPAIVRGWAWGRGNAGARMPWQGEDRGWHGQRVGGVRIESWCSVPECAGVCQVGIQAIP